MTNVIQIPQLPTVPSLNGTEALEAVQAGVSVQISVDQIAIYVVAQIPATHFTSFPSRMVPTNATANFLPTDTVLFINKTIAGPTTVLLPTPALGKLVAVQDMKGDAGANNITLDAGAGNLINGQAAAQTLVMNVNKEITTLIGQSDTQWGIWG